MLSTSDQLLSTGKFHIKQRKVQSGKKSQQNNKIFYKCVIIHEWSWQIAKYNLYRKFIRWWETLFFNLIHISLVIDFFFSYANNINEHLNRPDKYSFLEFQENAAKQLTGLSEYIDITVLKLT